MLDPLTLDLLACPACLAGPLREDRPAEVVRCPSCGRAFSLRHGMPDLLWGKTPPNEGPGDTAEMVRRRVLLDRRLVRDAPATAAYVARALAALPAGGALLDIGTGPGTIPALVAAQAPGRGGLVAFDRSWAALDAARRLLDGAGGVALLRASARRPLPLRSGAFAVVLRRLAPALPDEVLRVLAPGGTAINFTFGPHHWQEVYDAASSLPRPRRTGTPAESAVALRAQGFAEAAVEEHLAAEEVRLDDVALALGSNPAAYFLVPERDMPLLRARSQAQGYDGTMLRLTTHVELRIARKPDAATKHSRSPWPEGERERVAQQRPRAAARPDERTMDRDKGQRDPQG